MDKSAGSALCQWVGKTTAQYVKLYVEPIEERLEYQKYLLRMNVPKDLEVCSSCDLLECEEKMRTCPSCYTAFCSFCSEEYEKFFSVCHQCGISVCYYCPGSGLGRQICFRCREDE